MHFIKDDRWYVYNMYISHRWLNQKKKDEKQFTKKKKEMLYLIKEKLYNKNNKKNII